MGNKIIVEFDREALEDLCKDIESPICDSCKKTNKDLFGCHLPFRQDEYKIKEQNNEIKTKFKVGDKVWVVEYDSWNKWYVKGKFTVESLAFRKDSIAESICYRLEGIPV